MKKKLAAMLALFLLLPTVLLCAGAALPSLYGDSYYAELAPMADRLRTVEGKKLVLVGGSNIAFGTDTALLEELLHEKGYDYTVCPFGLYAAVGTSAMLSLSRSALGEGDIVILAIEPTDETFSSYFGAGAFWKCAEDAPRLLLGLSGSQRAAMLGNYVSYLQERRSIVRSGDFPIAEGAYTRSAFDESCNMIYPREGNVMTLGFDTGSVIDLAGLRIEPSFAEQVNDYCRHAARAGAAVYMSFSPMNRSAIVDSSDEAISAFFTLINESFPCPVISDPNDYMMDSGWFYDSNYHLNSAGAELRTIRLAQDILAQLGCYESIGYTAPAMPSSLAKPEVNAAETDLFLFSPVADGAGYLVSGLTEPGLSRTSLTVPSSCDGRPVVGFTPGALTGAASLEELRLPQSIETLPSGVFKDCPSMTRLILEHTQSPCGLEDGALDDAEQIRIYVPAEAYPYYRDGYGCEANPWAPYLGRIFAF